MYFNITEAIYNKPTTNVILKSCPLLPLLFTTVLGVLALASRQEQEIKGIPIGKEKVTCQRFAGDMILYIENPKESNKKQLELINE